MTRVKLFDLANPHAPEVLAEYEEPFDAYWHEQRYHAEHLADTGTVVTWIEEET